jgi:hypothetical protein
MTFNVLSLSKASEILSGVACDLLVVCCIGFGPMLFEYELDEDDLAGWIFLTYKLGV